MILISSGIIRLSTSRAASVTVKKEQSSKCSGGPTTTSLKNAKWSAKLATWELRSFHHRKPSSISSILKTDNLILGIGCISQSATNSSPEWETQSPSEGWLTPADKITSEFMLTPLWIIWSATEMTCSQLIAPEVITGETRIQAEEAPSGLRDSPMRIGEWLETGPVWRCQQFLMAQMISTAHDL